jgi:hypothetical protein
MFKNMKVGTKLLAVALAPLIVLTLLAGLGIRERLADADNAQVVETQARLDAANDILVHELQRERVLSAWLMSAAAEGSDSSQLAGIRTQVDEQRERTDEALAVAGPLIGDTGGGDDAMTASMVATSGRLDDLAVVRQSVDANQVDAAVALDIYSQTITLILDLNEQISDVTKDPTLAVPLQDSVTLGRLAEAESELSGLLTSVLVQGEFNAGQEEQAAELVADAELQESQLRQSSDAETKTLVRNKQARSNISDAATMQEQILVGASSDTPLGLPATDWVDASIRRINAYGDIQGEVVGKVIAETDAQAAEAEQAVRLYLLGALAALLVAVLLAVVVGRATTGPLRKLTEAADRLSTERLPRLVEQLKAPGGGDEAVHMELEPIDISSTDEIGQLADAFNKMQVVTAEVAEEQSVLLRKGIGDIFVNLARRNQTLLDRQIEFIDSLEANEEDPDQLEHLFKLDHLATRMRRNAESLLVLAGAEPPRRRARPVALADVVRVAVGEVEDFTRISLLALDEVTVGGNVAVDLAHLLSELMENATHFSPPDTRVEVVGHRTRDAGYIISVSDQGIGMTGEQVAEANELMASPPLVGLALSRSLGFIVIGRLAGRFGVSVRLTASPSGGVTALVGLPPDLVAEPTPVTAEAPAAEAPAASTPPGAPLPSRAAAEPMVSGAGLPMREPVGGFDAPAGSPPAAPPPPAPPVAPPPSVTPEPAFGAEPFSPQPFSPQPFSPEPAQASAQPPTLDQALPQGDAFEAGLAALLAPGGPETAPPPAAPPAPPAAPPAAPSGLVDWGEQPEWGLNGPATPPPAPAPPTAPAPYSADDLFARPSDSRSAPPNGNGHSNGHGNGLAAPGLPAAAPPPAQVPPPAQPAAPEWLPDDDFGVPTPTSSVTSAVPAPPPPPPAPSAAPPPPPPPPPPPGQAHVPALPEWMAEPASGPIDVPAEGGGLQPRGTRMTPAGLVQRTPRATRPRDLASDEALDDTPLAKTQRSPEEVRAMLSRYRSGLQRGRGPGDLQDPESTHDTPPGAPGSTWEGR